MFKIDLLQGQGIPARNSVEGIVATAVVVVVSFVVAVIMLGNYSRNNINISSKRQEVAAIEKQIGNLAEVVETKKSLEKEESALNGLLLEVSTSLKKHTQWSPVIAEFAKNFPPSLALTQLRLKQKYEQIRIPKKDDPQVVVTVKVPVRTLQINAVTNAQYHSNQTIKMFNKSLKASDVMKKYGLNSVSVSQNFDELDGEQVVSYQIDCKFKPKL